MTEQDRLASVRAHLAETAERADRGRRRLPLRPKNNARFGQKGGDGPNAGKKASKFSVRLPNGSVATKRAFNVETGDAVAFVYWHAGAWHVAGVWPGPTFPDHLRRKADQASHRCGMIAAERIEA